MIGDDWPWRIMVNHAWPIMVVIFGEGVKVDPFLWIHFLSIRGTLLLFRFASVQLTITYRTLYVEIHLISM